MKIRMNVWRITWIFLLVYLIIAAAAFLCFFRMFFDINFETGSCVANPWGTRQTIFVCVLGALFLATYIPSITCFYYIVEDDCFIMKRIGKDYEFKYSNIDFIDIEQSKRKKMVIFYSSVAKMRYLFGDKNGVLLETLIEKCPNIMSKEEFIRRHPEEKL